MGVYIKGMEMPQNCQSCNFYNGIGCKATGRMFAMFYNVATRRNDCPLIEVPEPHGALYDLNKIFEHLQNRGVNLNSTSPGLNEGYFIGYAPLIPASKEE